MTILMLGNKRASYCSEVHYWKTFEKLGHKVIFLQESEATGRDIINNSDGISLFFFIHTHGWPTPGIDEAFIELRKRNIPIVAYHLDLYFGLKREPQLHDYVTKVDHFFTADKLMADWLNDDTKTKGHYLPPGSFGGEAYMATPNREKYPHEIIFTGSRNYHPEYPYRTKLVDWLHETYGERFAHYGSGGLPNVRGHELNVLYASAKICIGDTLCKNFTYPWYFSDRLTETTCRGGFLIFPYIRGLEMMFDMGREIVPYTFNDFDQLKKLIDYYLTSDELRENIRLAGHKRAKESHTYDVRLTQLLDTLNLK